MALETDGTMKTFSPDHRVPLLGGPHLVISTSIVLLRECILHSDIL